MRKTLYSGIFSLAFIIFVIGSYVIVAQTVVTGDWTASTKSEESGKINLSFERRRDNGRSQQGSTFDFADLQGLTPEQAQNGKVSFRLVREAGTIECDGTFVNGKGSGTFRFTPDMNFVSAMKSRGFDFENSSAKRHGSDDVEDRLFAATTIGVTTKLADDLKAANFGPLDVDDLFKAAIFKITPEFMAEMKATGFPDLSMEDLVKARIFKIDANYVRQIHDMGFGKENFEGLVKFRIFKVTPELLNMLKSEGYADLSSEEVVKFQIFHIDQDFIRNAKSRDANVSVEELVRMKIGVGR
ncbi:MAG: hypothetical protein ABI791_06015 [Acidobacteriota bacterium]